MTTTTDVNATDIPTMFPAPPEHDGEMALDRVFENLTWWAEVDTTPVLDSVDDQMRDLRAGGYDGKPHSGIILFPSDLPDGYWTDGQAKDYLGRVMRYKRWLLARPEEGDRIRSDTEGMEGIIVRDDASSLPYFVKWDDGTEAWVYQNWVRRIPQDKAAPVEVSEDSEVTLLNARVRELEESLRQALRHHADDIAVIGERLLSEARDRDWCSEYDDVVRHLNRSLHVELPIREEEYEVEVVDTYMVQVVHRITVMAESWEAARERVEEDPDSYREELDEIDFSTTHGEVNYVNHDEVAEINDPN